MAPSLGSGLQVQMPVAGLYTSQLSWFSISAFIWSRSAMITDQLQRINQWEVIENTFAQINHHDGVVVFVPASSVEPADTGRTRWGRVLESAVNLLNVEIGAKLVKAKPGVQLPCLKTLTGPLCSFGAQLCRCANTSDTCSKRNECGLNPFFIQLEKQISHAHLHFRPLTLSLQLQSHINPQSCWNSLLKIWLERF